MERTADPVVEARALTRRFGTLEAVAELDLTISPGEVFVLLGRNGAGKTTTIKLLMGLLRPTAGESWVLGQPSTALHRAHWQQIGYVSEDLVLYDWLSVAGLLDFVRPLYPGWDPDLERALLATLALDPRKRVGSSSRGERAKAALLLALPYRPRLLVLDEPLSGLDPLARDELLSALLEVTAQNAWSVLFSTQDVDDAERVADRVGILDAGTLRLEEPLEALQARFRLVHVALRSPEPVTPPTAGVVRCSQDRNVLELVHERFSPEAEHELRHRFAGSFVEARPMSLREISVALARRYREEASDV
jgi:ABC-2 type transport system ATP-binding protein